MLSRRAVSWILVLVFCTVIIGIGGTQPRLPVPRDLEIFELILPEGVILERQEVARVSHDVTPELIFHMRRVPGSTYPVTVVNGPLMVTVDRPVLFAETEVTYELWYTVRHWALSHGYTFAYPGQEGSHGHPGRPISDRSQEPATMISWRDGMVWCNALSELFGLDPVYTYRGTVVRDATQERTCDHAVQEAANGFRLPTAAEWVLAFRYVDGELWANEHHASGAAGDFQDEAATTAVAWYAANSGYRTHSVGQKRANYLYLHDMSGNVSEIVFDEYSQEPAEIGGGFRHPASGLTIPGVPGTINPADASFDRGLRIVRTVLIPRFPMQDLQVPELKLPDLKIPDISLP